MPRWLRIVLIGAGAMAAFLLALVAALQVPAISTWAINQAAGLAPLRPGWVLHVGRAEGNLLTRIVLREVTLRQDTTLVARVGTVEARYGLLSLAIGIPTVDAVLVDDVEVTARRGPEGWDLMQAVELDTMPPPDDAPPGGFVLDTLAITNARARAMATPDSVYSLHGLILLAHDIRTGQVTTATLDTLGGSATPPGGGTMTLAARGSLEPERLSLPVLLVSGPRTRVRGRADLPLAWDDAAALDPLAAELHAEPLDLSEVAAWAPAVQPGHDLLFDLTARASDGRVHMDVLGSLGDGRLEVQAHGAPPRDGSVDLELTGTVERFDPALLVVAAPPSVVNGSFGATLAGPSLQRISGSASADITALRVATTDVDFIHLDAPVQEGRAEFTLEAELLDGRAEARGWVRPFDERPSFDLTASARGFPQLEPLAEPLGVPGEQLTLALTVAGDGADVQGLRARGRLDVASTDSAGQAGVVGTAPFEVADGRLMARPDLPLMGGRASGVVEADLAATPMEARARLALTGLDRGVRVDSLALDVEYAGDAARLTADARLPGEGRLAVQGLANLGGEVPELSNLHGAFTHIDLGAILPRDSLRTDLNGSFDGQGAGSDLASARAGVSLALAPSTINQATVERGNGRVELADGAFQLTLGADGPNGMLDLAAHGTVLEPERTVVAEGRLGVRDLDKWAGRSALAGHVDGTFRFDGAFDSTGIRRADGVLSARGELGEVVLDSVHAAVRANGRTSLAVDTILVRSNAVTADGGGVIALRAGPDTTAFQLVGGMLDATAVAATMGRQDVVVDTSRFALRAAGPATATRVTGSAAIVNLIYGTSQVRGLDGQAELVVDEGRLRAVAGTLSVPSAVLAGVPARDVAVELRYDSLVVASARAVLGRELALEARFSGRQVGDSIAGTVEALSLENSIRRWELEHPAPVLVQPVIRVDSLVLRSGTDRWIAVDGSVDPEGDNDLTLAFAGLTFDMYRGSGLDWLNGELEGAVTYGGTADAPAADGNVEWMVIGRDDEEAGVIAAEFGWVPAGVRLDARMAHADGSALTAEGWIPAGAWAAEGEAGALGDTLGLVIRSDGLNLQLLEALTPEEAIKEFSGQLVLDARLTGTAASPDASGSMRLVDATGNFPMVGVEYDEIALDASLAGNAFQLTEMRLQTGDGSMTATGQATLTPLANPGFDFEAQFDRFTLARTALLRSRVDSGGVRMSGTLEEPVLEGRVVLGRTDAYADGGGAATNAEAVELSEADLEKLARDFGPAVLARRDESTMLERFRMDLAVSMPGGVWVRRRREPKVDIEVRGDIKVTQEPGGEMQFLGAVRPVPGRGYINLYGKQFRLTSGEVKLEGPVEATKVEVVAEYEVSNKGGIDSEPILITVETSGTLDTLDVKFSSNPQMSQDDVLSYLITGRPASDNVIASTEGGSVGTDLAVGELAEGLSSAAGQAVGLDVFQIKPDGLRGMTMVAGQYVLPSLFLSMEQPVEFKSDADNSEPIGPSFEVEYGINSWLRSTVRAGSKPFALFLKGRRAY